MTPSGKRFLRSCVLRTRPHESGLIPRARAIGIARLALKLFSENVRKSSELVASGSETGNLKNTGIGALAAPLGRLRSPIMTLPTTPRDTLTPAAAGPRTLHAENDPATPGLPRG